MKKSAVLAALIFIFSVGARAQVTVTATVHDSSNIPYANATVSVQLIPSGTAPTVGTPPVQFSGVVNGRLDASGVMNLNLYRNDLITPSGTLWQFTICESPGVAPPLGTGSQCFSSTQNITAAVDLSATFNALAPSLTNISIASGTVTSVSCGNLSPLFTCSVATATTTPALSFALTSAVGGTVFGRSAGTTGAPAYTSTPVLGIPGTTLGTLGLAGNTSGTVTLRGQAIAGTPTVTFGTGTGTPAVTASSPLAINATTGDISCSTCTTGGITGSLTATRVPFASGAATLTDSANMTYVAANGLTLTAAAAGNPALALVGATSQTSVLLNVNNARTTSTLGLVDIGGSAVGDCDTFGSKCLLRLAVESGNVDLQAVFTNKGDANLSEIGFAQFNASGEMKIGASGAVNYPQIKLNANTGVTTLSSGVDFTTLTLAADHSATFASTASVTKLLTATNCANGASPAVCGSAASGAVAVPTGVNPTLVINSSAVTATSRFLLTIDESLTIPATTCNTTLATLLQPVVISRVVGVSLTIQIPATLTTNPACVGYAVFN